MKPFVESELPFLKPSSFCSSSSEPDSLSESSPTLSEVRPLAKMDGAGDSGRWSELAPEVLGIIFDRLSFEEKLTVLPSVCKSWRIVLMGPYCWRDLDIEEWSRNRLPHHVDRMLRTLIDRSGSVSVLCVSGLQSQASFALIAQNAGSLQTLRLQRSSLTDSIAEHLGQSLQRLSSLDLSYCREIGAEAIAEIGRHCKFLVKFCRNVDPFVNTFTEFTQDEEAQAIAATMPKLKHLEISSSYLRTRTLIKILTNCSHLEFIDLTTCSDIHLENAQVKQMFPNVRVRGPTLSTKLGIIVDWDYCSNDFLLTRLESLIGI